VALLRVVRLLYASISVVCASTLIVCVEQKKVKKQGRDDHVKQSSTQPPYISFFVIAYYGKNISVGGYILDCFM